MTLRLKGSYSVSAAENPTRLLPFKPITCNVIFLDEKSELFRLSKKSPGQVLIDLVYDFLEILERDFFGLQYNDYTNNSAPLLRWLEPAKTLKKQLRGAVTHTLWLRVKFYVPDPLWLVEEFTRYLVYLQVRQDVFNGILVAPTAILTRMAGLCLQSEFGDFSPDDCKPGYVNCIRLVPNQTSDFEAEAIEAHKSFRSYVPAAAELEYLNIARGLELYGIHPQKVIDRKRGTLSIGVSAEGLSVFREMRRISLYTWDNVEKIGFSGKTFSVSLKQFPQLIGLSKNDAAVDIPNTAASKKHSLTPTFLFDSAKRTKVFWQYAVTCHAFFRVKEPTYSGRISSTVNGGFQPAQISGISHFSSSPSGFSRLLSRRSSSVGTAGVGLERTMSTLMELRWRSKSIERGFFRRGVSRRFSRQRSFAAHGRTQSVGLLNAYESRDSLAMQSVPSLMEESAPMAKRQTTESATTTALEKKINGPLRLPSTEVNSVAASKTDRSLPRKFRSSAPPLSRLKNHESLPLQGQDVNVVIVPHAADNLKAHPKAKSMALSWNENVNADPSGVEAVNETPLQRNSCKAQTAGNARCTAATREDVLLRPTALFNQCINDRPTDEANQQLFHLPLEGIESTSEVKHQNPSKPSVNAVGGVTADRLSDDNLVTVRIRPNAEGQYGFNVHGGADHNRPVIVSRVGDNMPASTTSPRLHIGDQIIRINDRDISDCTQEQVVSTIQKSSKNRSGYLELVVKSNSNYLEENAVDDQFPDTGDAPPRPPKTAFSEMRNPAREASPATKRLQTSVSSQRLDVSPSIRHHSRHQSQQPQEQQEEHQINSAPPPKPRFNSSAAVSVKSTSRLGTKKALISDTEALYLSIRDIENGLSDGSLVRQFEKLERGSSDATMLDAKASINISKNRYRDISPYDHSRVRIHGADGDYINASFVNMKIPKADMRRYIASQGPLPTTCADFWQMCWEHDSDLIVMLTSVKEQGRAKCHKYWPDVNQTSEYTWTHTKASKALSLSSSPGKCIQLRISNVKEEVNADTAYREFQVQRIVTTGKDAITNSPLHSSSNQCTALFVGEKGPTIINGAEVRRIVQLQCVSWPDHGVPTNCSDLIAFVERMRSLRDNGSSNCTLVHCSAGIGRTGVLILLDTAMDMIHAHSPVHPIEMVRQIREYREMLIQTSAQFRFACEAITRYYSDTILRRPQTKKS